VAVTRVDAVVVDAAGSVRRVTDVLVDAEQAVVDVATVLRGAGGLVADAGGLLGQAQAPLVALLPVLERLSETLHPSEVDAAVLLVDRLPELLRAVDEDLLPLVPAAPGRRAGAARPARPRGGPARHGGPPAWHGPGAAAQGAGHRRGRMSLRTSRARTSY
jgi:hypothetical protein